MDIIFHLTCINVCRGFVFIVWCNVFEQWFSLHALVVTKIKPIGACVRLVSETYLMCLLCSALCNNISCKSSRLRRVIALAIGRFCFFSLCGVKNIPKTYRSYVYHLPMNTQWTIGTCVVSLTLFFEIRDNEIFNYEIAIYFQSRYNTHTHAWIHVQYKCFITRVSHAGIVNIYRIV